MGLPPSGRIPSEMRQRGYITIVRRNWHLLPYDQLLTLLDRSPEELAFSLREDDFLYLQLHLHVMHVLLVVLQMHREPLDVMRVPNRAVRRVSSKCGASVFAVLAKSLS